MILHVEQYCTIIMITKMKLFVWGLFVLSMSLTSCDEMLDTKSKTMLSQEKVQTESGVQALIIGAYDLLQSASLYGRDALNIPEVLADNSITTPLASRYKTVIDNKVGSHLDIWVDCYEIIALLNEAISYAQDLPESTKQKALLGEALALRGFIYFNLARVYGREPEHLVNGFDLCVPLNLEAFYYNGGQMGDEVYPVRSTVNQVWAQIESDLSKGAELLKGNDDGLMPKRMNHLAAMALLSRVYLYESKWSDCVSAANAVTDSCPFGVYSGDYTDIFSKGEENLFYVYFTESEGLGSSSLQSTNGITSSGTDSNGYAIHSGGTGDADLAMSNELVALFDKSKDKRFKSVRKAIVSSTEVYWTGKFMGYQGAFGLDNVPVIRMSEVVLNRAEAEAELNQTSAALADVNEIRTKRGLEPIELTGGELLKEVLLQRRLELCQEGHRFFDLKRRGLDISKPEGRTLVPFEDFRVVARISDTQMDANPSLVQNPGY